MKFVVRFLSFFVVSFSALAVDVQIPRLTEDVGYDPAIRGGEIVYVIDVLNGSNDTATNTLLTFPIPATAVFQSVDNGLCLHDGGTPGQVDCNLGDLVGNGLGGPITTIKLIMSTTSATGNTIAVGATITADTDTNTAQVGGNNNYESQTTTIDDGADLLVSSITDNSPVVAGGNVEYIVAIANAGPNDAASTSVVNTLPADLTYVSASGPGWACGNSGQIVTCTRPSIVDGATAPNITIFGKVTGQVVGDITNAVTVSSTTGDPVPNNNTDTIDTEVTPGADLSIIKSVNPDPVTASTLATFTLSPRNNGPFDVAAATVADTFPAGFTNVLVTNAGGWTCGVTGLDVSCNLASFTVGNTNNIVITATAPAAAGSFSNTATVGNTSGVTDPTPANNSSTIANVGIVPNGADLAITKSKTPSPVAQGSPLVSTIRVVNNGPQSATGPLIVTETLSGETYDGFGGANWACAVVGGSVAGRDEVIECSYGLVPLASGSSTSNLTINTTATDAGVLTNTAVVASNTTDGVPANNTASQSSTSTAAIADLSITKAASTPLNAPLELELAEDTITYTLTVVNNGPNAITDVADGSIDNAIVVTDDVPKYASNVAGATPNTTAVAMTSVNADFTCTTGATVTCRLNDGVTFNNGRSEVFTFTVSRPFLSGDHVNTARVSSAVLGDDVAGNNTSAPTTITAPAGSNIADVQLTAKTITPNPVKAGTNVTYVMSLRNNGPAQALDVTLEDVFDATNPVGKAFDIISVAASNSGSCDAYEANAARTLDCDFGTLARNATRSVTVVIQPRWDGANVGWAMAKTATVSTSTDQGLNAGVDSITATLNVEKAAVDLLVNNDEEDGFHQIGYTPTPGAFPATTDNIIVYKEVITNRGPSLATGIDLSFAMTPKAAKQLTFLCDNSLANSCNAGTSTCDNQNVNVTGGATLTLTCPQADMASDTTVTRYLFFKVDTAPDGTGDTHSTLATVSANEDDSTPANDSEGEDTVVRALVDVGVTKAPSQATVNVYEPFDWDLVISNDGPGDATVTDLTDNLPAGMELTGPPLPSAGSCTGASGDTAFTCNFGTLVNGDTRTLSVPVRFTVYPAAGTSTNTASVVTFGVDKNGANDSDSGTVAVQKSSITGTVYSDFNDDGLQNGVESGIANIALRLVGTDEYGNAVDVSVTSNASGDYVFDNLAPSDVSGYRLTETQPINFTDGLESVSGVVEAGTRGSDVFANIALAANTSLIDYDFGEIPNPGISGLVWVDSNNDGVLDVDETLRIPGVTINLTGIDHLGDGVNRSLVTDLNGQYNFINLLPSNAAGYSITAVQPNAWRDGLESLGTVNGVAEGAINPDRFANIVLQAAEAGVDYNFGERGGSLAGSVYRDLNDDGVIDVGETGIANVTLTLTGTDSDGEALTRSTVSDVDGHYIFIDLPSSNAAGYTLTETQPSGLYDGQDTDGSLANGDVSVNDVISGIVFLNTDTAIDYNFGEGGSITPEAVPSIGLAKSLLSIVNNGDDTYSATFSFTVSNAGETALENVQVVDDLTAQFGTYTTDQLALGEYTIEGSPSIVNTQHAASLTPAPGFTGSGANMGLLTPAASLLPSGAENPSSAQIELTLRFFPASSGPFENFALATGVAPITGVEVSDNSVDGLNPDPTDDDDPTNDASPTLIVLPDAPALEQSIGLAKTAGGITQTGNKRYKVPYSLRIMNVSSTVTATNVQVTDDLIATFPTAESVVISSPARVSGCTGTVLNVASPVFTGRGQNALLAGNQALLAGEYCTISFIAEVDFGSNELPVENQNNQALASTAETPNGTVIASDLSDDGINPDPNDNHDANEAAENDPTPVSFDPKILASVSGKVWLDTDHDRNDNDGPSSSIPDFIIEVLNADGQIVGTAISGQDGTYLVSGLYPSTQGEPSTEYTVRFRDPASGAIYGAPVSKDPDDTLNGVVENGIIVNVKLKPGNNTLNQSLPLDPSGVVYDSTTRQPIPGAIVTLLAGGSPVQDNCLLSNKNTQTTGVDGFYQYLLISPAPPGCPGNGVYTLQVVQPAGYLPPESLVIPAVEGAYTPSNGGVDPIQDQAGPPTGVDPTTYYFEFNLDLANSSAVVNNHIPLDPILGGSLAVTKTTTKRHIVRGEMAPYTISSAAIVTNITLLDQLPTGFKYIDGSATLDGIKLEPVQVGQSLRWNDLTFLASETKTIQLILIAGASVGEGEYVNQAWAIDTATDSIVSNIGAATVSIVPDPLFDCSDVIGKVFDDVNINGYQDNEEPGLAGVRIATARGLLVTTDSYGRFHVACADVPNEIHGSNFIMKLDERTLPTGYRVTTENPRVVRMTRGKQIKLNFGTALHRVVRIDLSQASFTANNDALTAASEKQLLSLIEILQVRPSRLRLIYAMSATEDRSDALDRVQRFIDRTSEAWLQCDCANYELSIEQEVVGDRPDVTLPQALEGEMK